MIVDQQKIDQLSKSYEAQLRSIGVKPNRAEKAANLLAQQAEGLILTDEQRAYINQVRKGLH